MEPHQPRKYVLDTSIFGHTALHRMRKDGGCCYESEILETSRNLVFALLDFDRLISSHPNRHITLALDSAELWRAKWLEDWHRNQFEVNPSLVDGLPVDPAAETLEDYLELCSKYKGNRISKPWNLAMTKIEFKVLVHKVAVAFASVKGWSVAFGQNLEADDVAYRIATQGDDIRFITEDSDWHQLQLVNPTHKIFTTRGEAKGVGYTQEELWAKVLSGDDGIPGVPKSATQRWGWAGALKLAKSWEGRVPLEMLNNEIFQRNLHLISMRHTPDDVPMNITQISPRPKHEAHEILKSLGLQDHEIKAYEIQGLL